MAQAKWQWANRNSGGTPVTLATTALNALANDAAVEVSVSNDTDLDKLVLLELVVAFGTAPVADRTVDVYARLSVDGTNYEDASASRPPASWPGASFVLDATTSQRKICLLNLPPRTFGLYLVNKAGQAFTASGHVLKGFFFNDGIVA